MNKRPSRQNKAWFDVWSLGTQRETLPIAEGDLETRVIDMLRTVYDPEIPVNIYDLGLVYGLQVSPEGAVQVRMTLTAPNCPVVQSFPDEVRERLLCVPGVAEVQVELVWDPPWGRERMTEAARLQLGLM